VGRRRLRALTRLIGVDALRVKRRTLTRSRPSRIVWERWRWRPAPALAARPGAGPRDGAAHAIDVGQDGIRRGGLRPPPLATIEKSYYTSNVEKFYEAASRSYVLRRINLEIKRASSSSIMGPSGAGKSTLLSILGMLEARWTGEFEL